MLQRVLQRRNQSLILCKIVSLMSEILTQGRDLASRFILYHYTVTRRARIASRTAIAVRNQIMFGRILTGFKKRFRSSAAERIRHDRVYNGDPTAENNRD